MPCEASKKRSAASRNLEDLRQPTPPHSSVRTRNGGGGSIETCDFMCTTVGLRETIRCTVPGKPSPPRGSGGRKNPYSAQLRTRLA